MSHQIRVQCLVIGANELLDDLVAANCDMLSIGHGFTQPSLDFDRLVPQPPSIRHAPSGDAGYLADRVRRRDWTMLRDPIFDDGPRDSVESLIDWLCVEEPGLIKLAQRSEEAFLETGHGTQESWRLAHWGSVDNAMDFRITRRDENLLAFSFLTSDRFPTAILQALVAQYPELDIHGGGEHQQLQIDSDAYEVFGTGGAQAGTASPKSANNVSALSSTQ